MSETCMVAALDGIRVIEFGNYVAAPYAGELLGDLGAEVTKVEPPPNGDPYRGFDLGGGSSPTFNAVNHNKRSILVDLRTPRGREVASALVARADVLIENSRVGAMERLGLGYEQVRATNPRLIYCSITGFGPSGPYRDRPGYDTIGQAMSGLLSLITNVRAPLSTAISLSDHLGGLFGCYGILAALAARERTGAGQRVDTSLLQASIGFLASSINGYLDTGQFSTGGTRGWAVNSSFSFTDRDGAPFVIHLSSPEKFWLGLLAAIGRDDLADDPRFATRGNRRRNHQALEEVLASTFRDGARAQWLARLEANDVPCSPINTLEEVVADPQVEHLGIIKELHHPDGGATRVVGSGVMLDGTPTVVSPAPVLDEHRTIILKELGYPADYLPGLPERTPPVATPIADAV